MQEYRLNDELIPRENWRWIAEYDDGTELRQFDDRDGTFHQFKEIDQTRVKLFGMVHDHQPPIIIKIDPSTMKLVHLYRNVRLDVGGQDIRLKGYLFGYYKKLEGKRQYNLVLITPDNRLVISDDKEVTFV